VPLTEVRGPAISLQRAAGNDAVVRLLRRNEDPVGKSATAAEAKTLSKFVLTKSFENDTALPMGLI
jgi:hypothetical protein